MEKCGISSKKTPQTLANSKIMRTFAPVFEKHLLNTTKDGPFVYRLGRKIFILERGVRFSHGLLPKTTSAKAEKKDGPFVYRLGRKIFILERGVRFSHGLRNRVTLFRFRIFSLPLLESIYKIRRGDTYMSTTNVNAELFRQLSYIADDENCMKKALDYIRKLAIQKEKARKHWTISGNLLSKKRKQNLSLH